MKEYQVMTLEPVSEQTAIRQASGRNWIRLVGLAAAILLSLSIPGYLLVISMGWFQRDVPVGPTVYTKIIADIEAPPPPPVDPTKRTHP